MSIASAELRLISVSGPSPVLVSLTSPRQIIIGRRRTHDLVLDRPEVSKDHAMLSYLPARDGGQWVITDTNSRHGTRLNGVELTGGKSYPVQVGDAIEILPWTLSLAGAVSSRTSMQTMSTVNDAATLSSSVSQITGAGARELAHDRLLLLLNFAESIQGANTEDDLAKVVLDAAVSGTGFSNAAWVKPMAADGSVAILARRGQIAGDAARPGISRTLIRQASEGVPSQILMDAVVSSQALSIAQLNIQEAICVPLMVQHTVAGFLYLDDRGRKGRGGARLVHDAGPFAVGVGRLASMALANMVRGDLERRFARMEGELAAAASAQQLILPKREGEFGSMRYLGECRPGHIVSGDFFDIIELENGCGAITLGDVSGKGVAASVLMTMATGFLHSALQQHGQPARAVHELSDYVHNRCATGQFITLWLGVFDPAKRTLTYVDAGQGYAWLGSPDGTVRTLDEGGGTAVGAVADSPYEQATVELPPGGRVMIVSDGIVEQPGSMIQDDKIDRFNKERIEELLRVIACEPQPDDSNDEVARVFEAVIRHAGTNELADDATVLVARW